MFGTQIILVTEGKKDKYLPLSAIFPIEYLPLIIKCHSKNY